MEAYESELRSVHFVGCKLSFVNLRGAELLDVAFTDCVIEELDLGQSKVRRVAVLRQPDRAPRRAAQPSSTTSTCGVPSSRASPG